MVFWNFSTLKIYIICLEAAKVIWYFCSESYWVRIWIGYLSPPLCIFFLVFFFFFLFFFYFFPLSLLLYLCFFFSPSSLFLFLFNSLLTCFLMLVLLLIFLSFVHGLSFSFFFIIIVQLSSPIVDIFTCYCHLERYALSFFLGFHFLFDLFVYLWK